MLKVECRVGVLFNSISTSVGYMRYKRLVLSSMQVLMIAFDYIWSDFEEKKFFFKEHSKWCSLVWCF